MRQSWWACQLVVILALCFPSVPAESGGAEPEQRSGSGWVSFRRLPESPDQGSIRAFLEGWEDYQVSQAPPFTPWDENELWVGYWDLNDDGIEEVFVSFYDLSSYFCGTGGCWILLFEKRDGGLHFLQAFSGFHVWVGDEKEELWVQESAEMFGDFREKRPGYRFFWARNLCEPIDLELRKKIPESFITNLSCDSQPERRSGSDWVKFEWFQYSPDQAFIRDFLENWKDYKDSQGPDMTPWPIKDLLVGYWDLNDDGVEEMFVSFRRFSPFCGAGGCTFLLFEKRDGGWHFLKRFSGSFVWIGEEKEEMWIPESIESPSDFREKRPGYRFFWTKNVCEPVEPELRAKIPEFFIVNQSC